MQTGPSKPASRKVSNHKALSRFVYAATFSTDEAGRILARFPDLPGAATDGANQDEAMKEAIDCLGSYLASRMVRKEEIPEPSVAKRGQRLVPVPLWLAPQAGFIFGGSRRADKQ